MELNSKKASELVKELTEQRESLIKNLLLAPHPEIWEHGARIDLILSRLVRCEGEVEENAEGQ